MKYLKKLLIVLIITIIATGIVIAIFFGKRDIPLDDLKAKYAGAPSQFILIQGMDVHFRDEGNPNDSLPLVLLHGTSSSLHTYDEWTKALTPSRRVIRMDLPAFGLTGPHPTRDYSMERYADFVHDFLNALEVEKCILGGNSLGGNITWNFALKYPERAKKLILIDASGYPIKAESVPIAFTLANTPVANKLLTFITPRFMAEASVLNVYSDKAKVTDELVDRYFELTLRRGNRQGLVDRMTMAVDSEAHLRIPTIEQPTLLLWGGEDYLVPIASAYKFQEELPNDTLVILPNLGHVPMEEDPVTSLEPVLAFIK
ncbi:MAG: alpha/beta hydrolase [Cytophagales bacterium]|nr:alpha/beta hydrolase [Cytophagales bacterium]